MTFRSEHEAEPLLGHGAGGASVYQSTGTAVGCVGGAGPAVPDVATVGAVASSAWHSIVAARREDGAPYLCERAVRNELIELSRRVEAGLVERNLACAALWRIAGCPPGKIGVHLVGAAEAAVRRLDEEVARLHGELGLLRKGAT